MKTPREKYQTDVHYNNLVKVLLTQIEEAKFTPSELREAIVLAHIMYTELNVRKLDVPMYPEHILHSLKLLEGWLDDEKPS